MRAAAHALRLPDQGTLPMGWLAAALALAVALGLAVGQAPVLALGGVLGIAFVCLMLADLTAGVVAFILLQFFAILPFASGQQVTMVKVAGAILVVSWLMTLTSRVERRKARDLLTEHPALVGALVLFLGWALLSTFWAAQPGLVMADLQRYALNFLLFAIVFTAVRSRRDFRLLAGALALGGAAAAVGGLVFGGSNVEGRLAGTVGQSNDFAAQLVPSVILALALAWTTVSAGRRLLFTAAGGLAIAGIVLSLARLGFIALTVAFVVWFLFGARWRGRILAMILGAALLVFVIFQAFAPPDQRDRVFETGGGSGRTDIWTVGYRVFENDPIRGAGLGNYTVAAPEQLLEPGAILRSDLIIDKPKVAHNLYLHLLAETGLVGGALLLGVFLACLIAMLRAAVMFRALGDRSMEALSRGLFSGTVGFLAAAFFISAQFEKPLWILLALGPALLMLARRGRAESRALPLTTDAPFRVQPRLGAGW